MSEATTLVSVQVGLPRELPAKTPGARPWRSAIVKAPVAGPVWLGRLGLAGDEQADRRYHGGPEQAVLAYAAAHYPLWNAELAPRGLTPGAVGENLTVEGQDETSVCLDDVYAIGEALVQVSCPRPPCRKVSRRWDVHDLAARLTRTGRTGWYLRVLREGEGAAGRAVGRVARAQPDLTVRAASLIRR